MAGTLTIDTLKASTGVLATQNGMTGIAKAWVKFNGSSAAVSGSYNVSSVSKIATGRYTVTYSTAMVDTNYAVTVSAAPAVSNAGNADFAATYTTANMEIRCFEGNSYADSNPISVAVFGN